jgi:hypothetical protein
LKTGQMRARVLYTMVERVYRKSWLDAGPQHPLYDRKPRQIASETE